RGRGRGLGGRVGLPHRHGDVRGSGGGGEGDVVVIASEARTALAAPSFPPPRNPGLPGFAELCASRAGPTCGGGGTGRGWPRTHARAASPPHKGEGSAGSVLTPAQSHERTSHSQKRAGCPRRRWRGPGRRRSC